MGLGLLAGLAGARQDVVPEPDLPMLDFLAGEWEIFDAAGQRVGDSNVVLRAPNAVIFEQRHLHGLGTQVLWFVNSERDGGWKQLNMGVTGQMREFIPQSKLGEWPMVFGADVISADGGTARYRLVFMRRSATELRRTLNYSRDRGATWKVEHDLVYRRKQAGGS